MRGHFCDYYIEFPIVFKLAALFIIHIHLSMFERKLRKEKEKNEAKGKKKGQ